MKSIHDSRVLGYHVDLIKGLLTIQTTPDIDDPQISISHIVFSDVLTHKFEFIIKYSIVTDLNEYSIDLFLEKEYSNLEQYIDTGWPLFYNSKGDLKEKLEAESYRYYFLGSAIGLSGWVLAKSYKII